MVSALNNAASAETETQTLFQWRVLCKGSRHEAASGKSV